MCIQDIRIGRNSTPRQLALPVAITAAQVMEANPKRIGLVLQNIGANPVSVSFGADVAAANGLLLGVNDDPIELYLGHGHAEVMQSIQAVSTVGASTLAVIETVYPGE